MPTEKDLQKDLEAVRADIAALTQAVGRLGADTADMRAALTRNISGTGKDAGEAGERLVSDAMKLGGDTAEAAADAARVGMSSLEAEIKRNPISAVLTALGIGFVIGVVGRR